MNKIILGFLFSIIILKAPGQLLAKPVTYEESGKITHTFQTVQDALDFIPFHNKKWVKIYIPSGIYKEKLFLERTKDFVILIGEDKFHTVLTFDDHTGKISPKGDTINTRTSYSFLIRANNFIAENISFQNDAGFAAGQAVAVESDGDKASFYNCRFIGNQDVLFTNNDSSRQFYKNCYIEGTTDFIFGSSTVWFEQCHIYSKKNSHITAAATPKDHISGYIFNDCVLTGDSGLHNVSLGRPWKPFANVIYIHCYLGPHIIDEGWRNWNSTSNYKTARFGEFENYGPGANPALRVSWAHQLQPQEMKKFTLKKIFENWVPDLKK